MKPSTLIATFLVAANLTAFAASEATPAAKRPNILFLFADDWAWPHASCLGCPGIKTPAFDRIANEGVLFRNAHAAAPSCSPSRAAILTGQWHWRLEQGANLYGFIPPQFAVYPDLLAAAGYFVGMTKKGYGPGTDQGRPHNAAGPGFKDFDAFLAARPQGKPFCFWYGSHEPHRGYRAGIGVRSGLDPSQVVVPPYLPDNAVTRSDICDYFYEAEQFDQQCAGILKTLEQAGELDNTLLVISGDNGWPFPRSKTTCYDSGTHQPLAIRWAARVKGGRSVDDFVSLSDLAPTFLEAAGLPVPATMTAHSLLPLLLAQKSGQIDPARDHILTGMERHGTRGRSDGELKNVGYPMRTLLTKEFHYLRNFKPDRWPAGDPPAAPLPTAEQLAANTFAAFADCDAGPTKAFVVSHRDDPAVKPFYERAFGKRPARELYDLRHDPYELKNLAQDPAYAETLKDLDARLMAELKATGDPRASGGGDEFDTYSPARPGQKAKPAVTGKNTANLKPAPSAQKPNVVLILADDLGYGDLGCYGSTKNRTPALDKMAREGLKLTSFYVTSGVCSPSRASLMTGCYPLRVGLHESSRGVFVLVPADQRGLNPAEMTLPRMFKQQDYATMIIGKWHLGDQPPFFPRKYGFDEYFGIPFSNDMGSEVKGQMKGGLPELPLIRNETVIEAPVDQNGVTKRYTEEAVAFLEKNKDKPFFLYLAHMQVHGPLRSGDMFRGKSLNGAYGDSVEEMDWSVGEVMSALKRLGLDENTLVIFTSDNGAISRGSNRPLSGGKATTLEGGMREPCIVRWPGKVPAGATCDEVASTIDLLPTLARLAGGTLPADRTIDGKDITGLVLGEPGAKSPHTEGFFYYFMSQLQAVRLGNWKLRLPLDPEIGGFTGKPKGKSEAQLYDLETDIGEKHNIVADHPDVVAQLTALAQKARVEIGDYKLKGCGQREPGYVEHPQLLRLKALQTANDLEYN